MLITIYHTFSDFDIRLASSSFPCFFSCDLDLDLDTDLLDRLDLFFSGELERDRDLDELESELELDFDLDRDLDLDEDELELDDLQNEQFFTHMIACHIRVINTRDMGLHLINNDQLFIENLYVGIASLHLYIKKYSGRSPIIRP